jgi:PEP-CTERM motif
MFSFAKNTTAALAVALVTSATPAAASVFLVTFSGQLTGGVDELGVLSQTPEGLVGLDYKVVYRFDTEAPGATFTDYGWIEALNGGSATVQIADHTWQIPSAMTYRDDSDASNPSSSVNEIYADASAPNAYAVTSITSYDFDFLSTKTIDAPFSIHSTGPTESRYFDFGTDSSGNVNPRWRLQVWSMGAPMTVSVVPLGSAVPEPATWAMMIAGFGLAGAGLRGARGQARRSLNAKQAA